MILLARVKRLAMRFMLVYEFCRDCGRRVEQVWTVSDACWSSVVLDQEPRCVRCFDHRATGLGFFTTWTGVATKGKKD